MTELSSLFHQNLITISQTNVESESLCLDKTGRIQKVKRNHFLYDLFHRILHFLFRCIEKNKQVNRVTSNFLNNYSSLKTYSRETKNLIFIALNKLNQIRALNYGNNKKALEHLVEKHRLYESLFEAAALIPNNQDPLIKEKNAIPFFAEEKPKLDLEEKPKLDLEKKPIPHEDVKLQKIEVVVQEADHPNGFGSVNTRNLELFLNDCFNIPLKEAITEFIDLYQNINKELIKERFSLETSLLDEFNELGKNQNNVKSLYYLYQNSYLSASKKMEKLFDENPEFREHTHKLVVNLRDLFRKFTGHERFIVQAISSAGLFPLFFLLKSHVASETFKLMHLDLDAPSRKITKAYAVARRLKPIHNLFKLIAHLKGRFQIFPYSVFEIYLEDKLKLVKKYKEKQQLETVYDYYDKKEWQDCYQKMRTVFWKASPFPIGTYFPLIREIKNVDEYLRELTHEENFQLVKKAYFPILMQEFANEPYFPILFINLYKFAETKEDRKALKEALRENYQNQDLSIDDLLSINHLQRKLDKYTGSIAMTNQLMIHSQIHKDVIELEHKANALLIERVQRHYQENDQLTIANYIRFEEASREEIFINVRKTFFNRDLFSDNIVDFIHDISNNFALQNKVLNHIKSKKPTFLISLFSIALEIDENLANKILEITANLDPHLKSDLDNFVKLKDIRQNLNP